jgi:hypothetical protein
VHAAPQRGSSPRDFWVLISIFTILSRELRASAHSA